MDERRVYLVWNAPYESKELRGDVIIFDLIEVPYDMYLTINLKPPL